jgi:rhodanese-related sulfurtransferase
MQASELLRRIQSNTAPVIVDVRFGSEFDRGHVPGAINTPFFAPEAAKLPADKTTEMVIYCGHGQRAWIAKVLLGRHGYSRMELLDGHMKHWKQAGLPLEELEAPAPVESGGAVSRHETGAKDRK